MYMCIFSYTYICTYICTYIYIYTYVSQQSKPAFPRAGCGGSVHVPEDDGAPSRTLLPVLHAVRASQS